MTPPILPTSRVILLVYQQPALDKIKGSGGSLGDVTQQHVAEDALGLITLVFDVDVRCYIYRLSTEIFIACVCLTGSISLAEHIYQTGLKYKSAW